ncbi:hypothetical protein EDB89DRAFT_1477076 [Lactarius sanguifluus]|nr:hypothetical protein EDB89DRAFT_1477076 [Lactarius sanguifluus]
MKKKVFWRFENPTLLRWVLSLPFALGVVHLTKHGSYRQPRPSGFTVVSRNSYSRTLPALALCRHAIVCDQSCRDLNEP